MQLKQGEATVDSSKNGRWIHTIRSLRHDFIVAAKEAQIRPKKAKEGKRGPKEGTRSPLLAFAALRSRRPTLPPNQRFKPVDLWRLGSEAALLSLDPHLETAKRDLKPGGSSESKAAVRELEWKQGSAAELKAR